MPLKAGKGQERILHRASRWNAVPLTPWSAHAAGTAPQTGSNHRNRFLTILEARSTDPVSARVGAWLADGHLLAVSSHGGDSSGQEG